MLSYNHHAPVSQILNIKATFCNYHLENTTHIVTSREQHLASEFVKMSPFSLFLNSVAFSQLTIVNQHLNDLDSLLPPVVQAGITMKYI